jgi:hypothetical protein
MTARGGQRAAAARRAVARGSLVWRARVLVSTVLVPAALTLAASPASADLMSVGQISASRSSPEVVVPIGLVNSGDVGGFALHLVYDAARLVALDPQPGTRTASFELFGANITRPGEIIVTGIADFVGGANVPPLAPGDGPVVLLRFAPAPGTPPGLVSLILVEGSLSNPSGSQLTQPLLENGWVILTGNVPSALQAWGAVKANFDGASR